MHYPSLRFIEALPLVATAPGGHLSYSTQRCSHPQSATVNSRPSTVNSLLSTVYCQSSTVDRLLSIFYCKSSTSVVYCQSSTVNRLLQSSTVNHLLYCQSSTVNRLLSVVYCQSSTVLSIVYCQSSTINHQLSIVYCQSSTVNHPPTYIVLFYLFLQPTASPLPYCDIYAKLNVLPSQPGLVFILQLCGEGGW